MKDMKIFSSLLCFCLLFSLPASLQAGTSENAQELIRLRSQARGILASQPQRAPYIRHLLTVTVGAALSAVTVRAVQRRAEQSLSSALIKQRRQPWRHRAAPAARATRDLFAKRHIPDLGGGLFDMPATAPGPKGDLSWLDEPQRPVTPKSKQLSLFRTSKNEITTNTFLSKYIMKNYRPRISLFPIEEQQGLAQALDEAVRIKKQLGRQAAFEFLEKQAFQSSRTSLYFIIAKRMLLAAGVLLAADFYLQPTPSQDMLRRLQGNPVLFLDATDEQLQQLARHPQAVSYCRQIVKTVDLLAHMPLLEPEQRFLKEIPLH